MNFLPRILKMLTELAARDAKYDAPRNLAQRVLYREIHAGRIKRAFADDIAQRDEPALKQRKVADLYSDIDNELGAEMVVMTVQHASPEAYAAAEELRQALRSA